MCLSGPACWVACACEAGRRAIDTTCSYARATQSGLSRLGSYVTRTFRVRGCFRSRLATTISLFPWRGAFFGRDRLKWRAQKPIAIAGAKLATRNICRELYRKFCNFVGSVLSPLLGNVYLHYVLDLWFETEVKPRLQGKATLIRYCDDFIIGFEREDDARRVVAVLDKRMGRFGLALHPDKTRLLPFRRPPKSQQNGKGPATFDFLGFTFYWARTREGHWRMACKTRRASLRRAKTSIYDWCRRHRHWSIKDQHAALHRRLRGHFNYFGVNGNYNSMMRLVESTRRAWYKWRRRRSQRTRLNWERFSDMLRWWPLPRPRITVRIWDGSPRATSTEEPYGGNLCAMVRTKRIAPRGGRSSRQMTLRRPPHLDPKGRGDKSMVGKREMSEDVYGMVLQRLRDMVRAELPES